MIDFNDTRIAFASKSNFDLLRAYNLFWLINKNGLVKVGTNLTQRAMKWGLKTPIAFFAKPTVFKLFCGGETLQKTQSLISELKRSGVETILDYGAEAKNTEQQFIETTRIVKESILFAADNAATNIICSKFTGLIQFNILEKLHAGITLSNDEQKSLDSAYNRIEEICKLAYQKKISLFVDAEESWIQKPLDEMVERMMRKYNKEYPCIYNTVQLYLQDSLDKMKLAHQKAKKEGYIYAAKIVRGAYMDKEAKRAKKLKYKNPIQPNKTACDRDYNTAVEYAIIHHQTFASCIATHNEESCQLAVKVIEQQKVDGHLNRVVFSQLLGMSDHISFNLAKEGYRVAKYMPYGYVKEVIPYLLRRAEENTSVSGQMSRELSLLKKEMKRRGLLF